MTRSEDSHRVYLGLLDLFERRVSILFAKTGKDWRHFVGPVYDPATESGGGRTCARCRKVQRYDRLVCGSCGFIAR